MTSMQQWTPEQWAVFTVTIAAGVIAATLVAVLRRARWAPPALLRARGPGPRPTVVRAVARAPLAVRHDPMELDYTDPGIGALSSIQIMTVDPTLKTSTELRAETDAWVNAYADLSFAMPETAQAAEDMRITLEPVLRKARRWLIQGGEGGAGRKGLADWRIGTATGEYPRIDRQYLMARALLVS